VGLVEIRVVVVTGDAYIRVRSETPSEHGGPTAGNRT